MLPPLAAFFVFGGFESSAFERGQRQKMSGSSAAGSI
jgi:hypothetical protein